MKKFNLGSIGRRENVAVDFGNNNIVIANHRNQVWTQPSVVTLNGNTKNGIKRKSWGESGKSIILQ